MDHRIRTARLVLRRWHASDIDFFAALHSEPAAMSDLGGPIKRSDSEEKFQRYCNIWRTFGYGRWCVTDHFGNFIGYVGVNRESGDHPIGPHDEIGWRLHSHAWGKGFAVEAASAAIKDAFDRNRLTEILAYTAKDNLRSQAVIAKLPFERAELLDFSVPWKPTGTWSGMVWKTNKRLASDYLQNH